MTNKRTSAFFQGCILGGAVGDALGSPIEFMSIDQIRSEIGETGLQDFSEAYGRLGAVTDDTQMTLFTTEGLILSNVRQEYEGDKGIVDAVYHALLRWLYTQEVNLQGSLIKNYGTCSIVDGVLTGHKELFSLRAPDKTCLTALKSGKMGTVPDPVNNSRRGSGVARMAPVGLVFNDAEKAFHFGTQMAALTHGHPTGFLAAGTFAALISLIISGRSLTESIEDAFIILRLHNGHEETLRAVSEAVDIAGRQPPDAEVIETIGAGWMAAEALAISLYCSLENQNDFRKGILLSVNHSGNSDSTGSISGNILGALHGDAILPENWIERLELNKLIKEMAGDLFDQFG